MLTFVILADIPQLLFSGSVLVAEILRILAVFYSENSSLSLTNYENTLCCLEVNEYADNA